MYVRVGRWVLVICSWYKKSNVSIPKPPERGAVMQNPRSNADYFQPKGNAALIKHC